MECANGCNQVVFHLQAVADLIRANGLASHMSPVLHRRKGFLTKKDRYRKWQTSPRELGFGGASQRESMQAKGFSHV